jgi:hypothetical protein
MLGFARATRAKHLREALLSFDYANNAMARKLSAKLTNAVLHPEITIGVHGGQVQWIMGNPFPVRVCDYDRDRLDLPDVDERGQCSRLWFEPSDAETQSI